MATFAYGIDPDEAYTAGLALQARAAECRRTGEARLDDDDITARGRAIARELADCYDRVAAALMRPTVLLEPSDRA